MLLMVGNGMQGTLLGVRGTMEGFSTFSMSIVMASYYGGFLLGSRLTPWMIRRVGHVRVFAALGSLVSALLVLYAVMPNWVVWSVFRVLAGLCFSGIYVTSESWLNNSSSNETRGQALSLYMIVQMIGIIAAQVLMNVGDPSDYLLFIIPSVLVSLAFLPILLSDVPAPEFEETAPMTFGRLFHVSPLGCIGMFLMGGVFSALFGMVSVWGTQAGLSVRDISIFVGAIYVGGLVFQYPIGWASDRYDRRMLILGLSAAGAVAMLVAFAVSLPFALLLVAALIVGGVSNPLYSLLIAYTNDFLPRHEMASASGGLLFINGTGAILGPLVTAWLMDQLGPRGFFLYLALLLLALAGYAGWRMTRRAAPPIAETGAFAPLAPSASSIAVGAVVAARKDHEQGE